MVQKLQEKKYVENVNGALIPTENGRRLWLEVVPLYNNQSDEILYKIFSTEFTSMMELKLDNIANSDVDSAMIWHDFVFDFYEIHNKVLDLAPSWSLANFGKLNGFWHNNAEGHKQFAAYLKKHLT